MYQTRARRRATSVELEAQVNIKALIRTVPDFPRPGIRFRDITPLLASGRAVRHVIGLLAERYAGKVDKVAGVEARGFIFSAAVAQTLGAGFIPLRKPGKLPGPAIGQDYALESSTAPTGSRCTSTGWPTASASS